ncbi:hypothetical protein KVR01_003999 [Diaporthe batatas]|uniref:uncharacterized protein n=1 Tax=Diaporthe batatas TaxID=748121 RepID=UPI001D03DDCA|nr:uncharacterized protein KVR01_003999 [Diaporthe batatas]KAG8168310.1 hypothetical protein KVR01_003999 [Diaporthe batatas]
MAPTRDYSKPHAADPPEFGNYLQQSPTSSTRPSSDSQKARMPPERQDLKTVRTSLQDGRVRCVALVREDDRFLPRNTLEEILTERTIESLLLERDETSQIHRNTIVGDTARIKLFAILILLKKTKRLGEMIRLGISDDRLPLSDNVYESSHRRYEFVDRFLKKQPLVAVPAWDFTSDDIRVEEYTVMYHNMPFLKKENLSRGAQGTVWKVEIHHAHFTGRRTGSDRWECFQKGPEFAVKEFSKKEEFEQELSALTKFNSSETKHRHLIRVLAAYSQGRTYFLILPLAKGDLVEFWRKNDRELNDPLWLLQQCRGLTDGLYNIHEGRSLRGRHGDIKPPNILWFIDESTRENRLVLSDFTLMRFHEQGSKTETLVHSVGRTRTYRAPELDAVLSHNIRISQKYDVWSLGCVFLEFISCHLVGYNATRGAYDERQERHENYFEGDDGQRYETFDTTRVVEDRKVIGGFEDKYFVSKEKVATVKESVTNWISYLRGLEHCPPALSDFLELIQNHMLVINPTKRWGSKEVLGSLDGILNQKAHPKEYYNTGRSRAIFQRGSFLHVWDESSYDRELRHKLNDPSEQFVCSVNNDMEHDLGVFDAEFRPQSSNPVYHPSRFPPSTTSGDALAPGDERRTISEESVSAQDHSSRETSVDLKRASYQDLPLRRGPLDNDGRTPQILENPYSMSSNQASEEFVQHDASQDAHFLRTPSKSYDPPTSRATSVFSEDLRPISIRTGPSTPDPDEVVEAQSNIEKHATSSDLEAIGAWAADDDSQVPDRGGSDHEAGLAQEARRSRKRRAPSWGISGSWTKKAFKRVRRFVGLKTEDSSSS